MRRLPIILCMVIGYALGVWAQGPVPSQSGPIISGGGGGCSTGCTFLGTTTLGGQLTWSAGLGSSVVHLQGPSDQNFLISSGTSRNIAFEIGTSNKWFMGTNGGLFSVGVQTAGDQGVDSVSTLGYFTGKTTAAAAAPGATLTKLEVRCGTSSGTAAMIIYAGTSAVAKTVVDNIGSGVTGC